MSFIAPAKATVTGQQIITNSDFYPDINLTTCRETMRLDGTVTEARLKNALINAMSQVNQDLYYWRQEQIKKGYLTLADVPAETIAGDSILIHHYERAVFCFTRANTVERYIDYDSTGKPGKDADTQIDLAEDLRRDGRYAVRDILGHSHVTVELI